MIGHLKYPGLLSDVDYNFREYYVGEEARNLRGVLSLVFPVECGMVTNWEAIEKIWHYIFHDLLQINPSEHPVLLTEPPLNPAQNREKMAEILFENFNVPAIYVSSSAVLSLLASGRTTGLVIDMGESVTHIVPIYKGIPITSAICRLDIGGHDITKYLYHLLRQRSVEVYGYTFSHPLNGVSHIIARETKERFCYVALDPARELRLAEEDSQIETQITLLFDRILTIGSERFLAPEILFAYEGMNRSVQPLHEAMYQAMLQCGIDLRNDLCQNIVLSGGSSQFPGLKERLCKELTEIMPETSKIRIIAPPERGLSAWIGGAMLASHKIFPNLWFSRKEYMEQGPIAVHHPFLRDLKINSLKALPTHLCPFCGTTGLITGQKTKKREYVFCPTCQNILH